ncbi:MAG: GMP/IMP nucleotidase [Gammaproteobacteria bacterium]|nr:GMP/IMP nucleotidase [Gammaproteobacteria bacterium]
MLQKARLQVDWEGLDNVFLDMDGTLLDLHFDNYFWQEYLPRHFGERRGLSTTQAQAQLRPRFRAVEGTLQWYSADFWSAELGLDILALTRGLQDSIHVHAGAVELLQRAQAAHKRLVLLTNAHPGVLAIKLEYTGLGRFFDRVVSAHALGHPKENAGFWHSLRTLEPFERHNTLFVDDSLPVLRAAQADGMDRLIAVRRPDSQLPVREIHEFPSVESLAELVPESNEGLGVRSEELEKARNY